MKKIILISLILLVGCTKMEIEPVTPPTDQNIFSVSESVVTDGQIIQFDLPSNGIYTLTLIDKETSQAISREKFTGKSGVNIKKIYTNSLKSQSMYLLLEDFERKEIKKTIIRIK